MVERFVEHFGQFLAEHGFSSGLDDALEFQENATGKDRYKIVDLAVGYVQSKGGTYYTMKTRYSQIRSFFLHKHVELPKVPVSFTPTSDATVGKLNREIFPVWIREASLRDQAVYLSLLQGFMDQKRFFESFNPKGFELGQHIKEKGVDELFQVQFLRGKKRILDPTTAGLAMTHWKPGDCILNVKEVIRRKVNLRLLNDTGNH